MAQSAFHPGVEEQVRLETGRGVIEGGLVVPEGAQGVVLFAHGSGSSRHSPRNRFVAGSLQDRQLGTLLIDLLTPQEEQLDAITSEHRFDIPLLAERLLLATDWLLSHVATRDLPIGYFGASTGAAAALIAAAQQPAVQAVVSRGGRPDLAGDSLPSVRAATLLIVGDLDFPVIPLNREAFEQLAQCRAKEMALVTDATHLFEEEGALEEVARLAGDWFTKHLHGRTSAGKA
jgi:pimeloyl-ACP methyl ester carboxylesterase